MICCIFFVACKTHDVHRANHVQAAPVTFSVDQLEQRTFKFFWDLADKTNFQIPDRYPTLTFSSIAATGFGLSAYIVGAERHYVTRTQAAERTWQTLNALMRMPVGPGKEGISGYHGFFYHFLTLDKTIRYKDVELSSIDTGLLMAGILSAMSYFDGSNETEKAIHALSDSLYRRVEWNWMLNNSDVLSMGWHPENGFIPAQWKGYNEAMILLIMAMGSPTHPIPAAAWDKWCSTYTWDTFEDQACIQFDPLFGHQYSHVWIDFKGIQDIYMKSKGIDYFENSRRATLANRSYCIENPMHYKGYGPWCWGLTACDGPKSITLNVEGKKREFFDYRARGACSYQVIDDGTIAPTAAGGSYPFCQGVCDSTLSFMAEHYPQVYGEYGFKDAFNLTYVTEETPLGWFDLDYLGIDQGPILLMIENQRTELIWNVMKKNPYIIEGLRKAGFTGGWLSNND